jgi:hypothetical protein
MTQYDAGLVELVVQMVGDNKEYFLRPPSLPDHVPDYPTIQPLVSAVNDYLQRTRHRPPGRGEAEETLLEIMIDDLGFRQDRVGGSYEKDVLVRDA